MVADGSRVQRADVADLPFQQGSLRKCINGDPGDGKGYVGGYHDMVGNPGSRDHVRPPAMGGSCGQLLLGVVVVAVLWLLGHHFGAIVVCAAIATVSLASALSEGVGHAVEGAIETVKRVTGRILSFLLLWAVQIFVFVPLSVLFRLIGRDPLSMGLERHSSTRWRPHASAGKRSLYHHQFAYEITPSATAHRSLPRSACIVLGSLTLILLLDVAFGSILDAVIGPMNPAVLPPGNLFTILDSGCPANGTMVEFRFAGNIRGCFQSTIRTLSGLGLSQYLQSLYEHHRRSPQILGITGRHHWSKAY